MVDNPGGKTSGGQTVGGQNNHAPKKGRNEKKPGGPENKQV